MAELLDRIPVEPFHALDSEWQRFESKIQG